MLAAAPSVAIPYAVETYEIEPATVTPATTPASWRCIPPTVTYLGRGPGRFIPSLNDTGVFVAADPPVFAASADLQTSDHVWSIRTGNASTNEVRVLPPGYHLFVGDFLIEQRVRLWVFGHAGGSVRFYDAGTGRDLLVVPPGNTALVEFTTISDGRVVVVPAGSAYVMLPPCAERVMPPGTIPPKDPSPEPEWTWRAWLPWVEGDGDSTQ